VLPIFSNVEETCSALRFREAHWELFVFFCRGRLQKKIRLFCYYFLPAGMKISSNMIQLLYVVFFAGVFDSVDKIKKLTMQELVSGNAVPLLFFFPVSYIFYKTLYATVRML
jgi:hypothetical protein